MELFLTSLAISSITVGGVVVIAYLISIWRDRNDVADIMWGIYFWAATVAAFLYSGLAVDWRLVPLGLITVWAVRLSSHIASRHAHTNEDPRYHAWRIEWMNHGMAYFRIRSFVQVFLLQGILAILVVMPGIYAMSEMAYTIGAIRFPIWLVIGSVAWLAGFLCESLADRQLKQFLADLNNKGTIMRSGLWAYSRHPNYFGEILQWIGIWIITLPTGWFTVIGPITIYMLIRYVSGIPLAERSMSNNPLFQEYQATTSPLIPIPHWITNLASPRTLAAMLIEFGPLLLFFVTFEFFDFFTSVMILVVAVCLALYGSIRLYRKISLFPVLSSGSVILFGLITVITNEPFWIIFKDTLYFGIFGLVILIPLLFKKLILKKLFDQVFAITDKGWVWVSWNWAIFMIAIAISNEIVRVRLTPGDWVRYKMIVLIVLVIFSIWQFVISAKERLPEASALGLRK